MKTIEDQIRSYAEYADDRLPWVDPIDVMATSAVRTVPSTSVRIHERPKVWVAFVAAALVAFIVGGLALLSAHTAGEPPSDTIVTTTMPSSVEAMLPVSISDPNPSPALITSHPLPEGAIVAFTVDKQFGSKLIVTDGEEFRAVTTGRGVGRPTLSQDGRLLAYTGVPYGGDTFTVVDLTTGVTLYEETVMVDGASGHTGDLQWSADGRRLAQVVQDEATYIVREVRVWEHDRDSLTLIAVLNALPGGFIGMTPDGSEIVSESDGFMARYDIDNESWSMTEIAARPEGGLGGEADPLNWLGSTSYRWSLDGTSLAWLGLGTDNVELIARLDLSTAEWQTPTILERVGLPLLGWYQGEPIVHRFVSGDRSEIVSVAANGELRTVTTLDGIEAIGVAQGRTP